MKAKLSVLLRLSLLAGLTLLSSHAAQSATADDWRQFRGPDGQAISRNKGLPTTWSGTQNLVWKTELPGPGGSSPIVLGDHVYVTCYSGYAVPGSPGGDVSELQRHVLCLQRTDGKVLWKKDVPAAQPEQAKVRDHGYASSTPLADPDRLYVFLGKSGVFAYSHDGKQLWQADVGSKIHGWGSASSPVLYKDLVIINAAVESDSLVALNKQTGKEVWRAGGMKESWNTPILVPVAGGKQELVVAIAGKVLGFDPATGEPLWSCATVILRAFAAALPLAWLVAAGAATPDAVLFRESFDDAQLQQRGWYDVTAVRIAGQSAAGQGCIQYEWTEAQSGVRGSSPARHQFEPTDEVAIRFHLKLSKGWGWSGQDYHPHLTHFLTTENSAWHGPAVSHLTLYIEPVGGKLRLAAQDIQNEKAPHGLTQGPLRGGYNGKFYDSAEVVFTDDQWHCVEAYFRLNTLDLKNNRAHPDGIVRGWFDGRLVIEHTNVVLRSPDFPKMKFNQFLMAPYFGPGLLPHAQRLWIDELAVGTRRIGRLSATSSATAPPDGNVPRGIAAAYPGDLGLEKGPSVVFAESFEGTGFERWNNAEPPRAPKVQLVTEKPRVHGGKQAVQFTVPPGKGVGAGLVKWFKPGYDQLYARWYCLFADDYDQGNLHHTGAKLAAETNRWHLGVAGQKPTGRDFFITGLEPWRDWKRNPPPGELMFYTYYPDMKRDPDGNYWGNSFKPEKKCFLERGRWYCLEIMVKANTPGQTDGEQAFWVDGGLIGRFTGIRWRDTETLKLNCFWPSMYIHDSPQTNRVWMDDMVVATKYIGPMIPKK